MDWQSWTAVAIATLAALWAGWKILRPIVNEFRTKKTPDAGCCGCGVKDASTACGAEAKKESNGARMP